MPANTSPDNIVYPVSTDPVAPLETVFANMANSVQDALDGFRTDFDDFTAERAIQTFRWADSAARNAQTGMVAGDIGYQIDTAVGYTYSGSGWVATGTVALLDKNGTGYSVPNNAFTQLTDTYLATTKLRGMTTSGGAITVPTDGLYRVTASALFAANGTGSRQVDVTKNSTVAGTGDVLAGNVAGSAIVNGTVYASKVIPLAAGDVLRLFLYQNSGASLALGTGGQTVGTFFHVEFAGMP